MIEAEENLRAALEAILFTAGEPIEMKKLCEITQRGSDEVMCALESLREGYLSEDRGIELIRLEERWQLATKPLFGDEVRAATEQRRSPTLSASALEVLTVAAYRQPVTRAEIEQVRGVDSSYTVSSLVEKGILEEAGRLDVPGRPIQYRTTDLFLRIFGISSLEELPPLGDVGGGI